MTLLHGAVRFHDDDPGMGLEGLVLRVAVDRYRYRAPGETEHGDPVTPSREAVGEVVDEFDLPPTGGPVEMRIPGRAIVGDDLADLAGWAQAGNWDDLTVEIRYAVGDPERTLLAFGTWEAYLNVDDHVGDSGPNGTGETLSAIDDVARQVFLVDAAAYRRFLERHPAAPGRSDRYGLDLLRRLGVFTSTVVRLEAFTDDGLRALAEREKVDEDVVKDLVRSWHDLTTFTVTLEPLVAVDGAGQLTVVSAEPLAAHQLARFRLTGGLTVATVDGRRRAVELDPRYGDVDDPPTFPLAFELRTPSPLATVSARGPLSVRVRGVDGSDLWSDAFDVDDPGLQALDIEFAAVVPGTDLAPSGDPAPASTTDHRLRGQVVHASGEATPAGLTIVVQAKESDDDPIWQLVSAGSTEAGGYFSMPYPSGDFARAQALVSVAPDDVVDLRMVEGSRPDETIADDFVYLLLTRSIEGGGEGGSRPARLPGQADLIRSGQYTQDLGGGCMNITTPNRTLREYRYHGVVRTSDPDVANYTLRKERDGTFALSGGASTLERRAVDLNNPIRWMDAPEAGDHLSFYQAVSVATGHILYYRSVLKADGYSLGDLVYTLPLAPGQKKQIVSYDMANTLELAESQRVSQGETLAAGLQDDRTIADELSGGIAESMAGSSKAHTSGMSAGLGAAGGFGPVSASLGVSGGFANSNSEASQNGSRNISQTFGETLRQSLLQRAESYRELNASVVKTVRDGEEYAVTTEVVANHNHCHSLTMMYFEVLRHYAVSQELAEVRECLFVPLLLTEFVPDNVARFKDVLATNLLAVPSTTYGRSIFSLLTARRHPLLRAFDANDRIRTGYSRVDYPTGSYAEDPITSITGEMRLRTDIPRPRTRADRVISLPIVTQVVHSKVTDTKATVAGAIFSGGLSLLRGGTTRTVSEEILVKERIFDQFLTLDDNFQTVPPARAIRVTSFEPQTVDIDGVSTTLGFFQNPEDERQWQAYADLLGFGQAWRLLEAYFAGNLISEWDEIFRRDIAPRVFDRIIDSIGFTAVGAGDGLNLDLTPTTQYRGGERAMTIRLAGGGHRARNQLAPELRLRTTSSRVHDLKGVTLTVEKISLDYATAHFRGPIYRGYAGNDLLDSSFATSGVLLPIPLTARDKVNPRTEDQYLVGELLDHLNAHIEHYNRALWTGLDDNRRYMLLDGFSIETYKRDGTSGGLRSLASVVKNELVTVAGNSLVFPVAEGYHVDQSLVAPVEAEEGETAPDRAAALYDRYLPLREVEPYRLSVPTRGVYAEAVLGECDSCEDVKPNSSQDWTKFTTDEPTVISAVTTPTPGPADWRTVWAQFANPLVALQTPRELPAPGAALAGLSDALTKSDSFANITGLTENQKNAMATYQSNQENARAFAEMAKGMALQEMNSTNSRSIMEDLREANQSGALSDDDYQRMVRDHLGQRIDGGERQRTETEAAESSRPSLTNAAIEAARTGRDVEAHRTETDGTTESVRVSTNDSSRSWIIFDPSLDAQARAFHPRARDITGRTTLTVSVPDLPEGGIVRWRIPAGSEGHYTFPGGASRFDGTSVTIEASRPGKADIDVAVIDAGGTVVESQKLALCVPQFVEVGATAAFTTVMTGTFGLIAEELPAVLEETKEVCDLILATANVRTVWTMAPFSQQLPTQMRAGAGAALVTHATFEGDPPQPSLLGRTQSVAGGLGPADFDERITVWPGAADDDVVGNPAEFVDDATRAVIRTIAAEAGMSSSRKARAMSVLARLLGETLAHEVVHSLIGRTLSGGGHHASPGIEHALMNQGSDRTFEGRTGFELTAPASTADIVDDLVDNGIGVINIPVQDSQRELDTHIPVPPAFQ
jgi:hypothetical protein